MVSLTPNPSYSVTVRVQLSNQVGTLGSLTQAIGMAGGNIGQIDLVEQNRKTLVRDIVVDAASTEQAEAIVAVIKDVPNVKVLSVSDRTFDLHRGGKIRVEAKIPLRHQDDLAMAYTPGVGRICKAIAEDPSEVYRLTMKSNSVAIVTDGSAVLGLGNLGPAAALPVMEGKAMLFREFAGIDAFPLCLATQDPDAIVETVKNVSPIFGGINLEDIGAPRCFDIERRLQQETDIPIFHDDQHGTAIVTLAALFNALRLVKKSMDEVKIVINGAGAAGVAIARLLRKAGATHIVMCDSKGILSHSRENLTLEKQEFAVEECGTLANAMTGADVFLGVSAPGVVTPDMVRTMAGNSIVFAMANPIPEIQPELITEDVAVMATGRSDYPNQINNVLAFPGVFRGALDCRAREMTINMFLEAASAIASLIKPTDLDAEHIIPSVFDPRVVAAVSSAVQHAARQDGVAES